MIKLRCTREETYNILEHIHHRRFQNAITNQWLFDKNGDIYPQSICWLYCWGKTGMNSINAANESQIAFNSIFNISFNEFDSRVDHDWARAARYNRNWQNIQNKPTILL